jgi:hypothetical protein
MTATSRRYQSPDDIDRLLADFFRGEVPDPWPTLRAPVVTPVRRKGRSPLRAGRLALAASIAALVAGGWLLSGRMPNVPPNVGSLDSGNATAPREMRSGNTPPTMPPTRNP